MRSLQEVTTRLLSTHVQPPTTTLSSKLGTHNPQPNSGGVVSLEFPYLLVYSWYRVRRRRHRDNGVDPSEWGSISWWRSAHRDLKSTEVSSTSVGWCSRSAQCNNESLTAGSGHGSNLSTQRDSCTVWDRRLDGTWDGSFSSALDVHKSRLSQESRTHGPGSGTALLLHLLARVLSVTNHQPLLQICITLPVESAPFFIPSTSFCSLSSWFTSFCTYHLITVTTFALTVYHFLGLSFQT